MRGGVQLIIARLALVLTSILALALLLPPGVAAHRCDRTPEGNVAPKTPADNRYQLKISGSPDKYVPDEGYTITLCGQRSHGLVSVPKFTGFMLMVEAQNHQPLRIPKNPRDVTERPVGAFQLYGDTMTKFSTSCPNTVTHTSGIQKTEVQVRWTAPPQGSGCVIFRATVIEHRDMWYQDDGPLSKMLCEEVQENLDVQPEILDHCCACDEAKYEVTFEGLWSRHTHPKDFPSNSWLTRFSDVIGASHSPSYKFWEYGGVSSDGLRQVAEHGSTRALESELKSNSGHIRTIIKARGISYPNVTGKTFAVFRVNRHHHLMSLVSMIDPSPDWIVGVSALELCLRNCSWVEAKVQNLYPWDAGTDSGVTYISPDQPTYPRDKIRRITSSFPNDQRSPFYDSTGAEMKPLARLYLTRQRLYEKTCDDDSSSTYVEDCKLSEWADWGECKPIKGDCGPGRMYRQRTIIKKTGKSSCLNKLYESKPCVENHCRPSAEPTEEPEDPNCETANWADWSRCTPSDETCTQGKQTRYRKVRARSHPKYCLGVPKQETRHCTLNMSPVICPKNSRGRAIYKGPQTSTCCGPIEETNEQTTESVYGDYGDKSEGEEPALTEEEPDNTEYRNSKEVPEQDGKDDENRSDNDVYRGDDDVGYNDSEGQDDDLYPTDEPSGECAMTAWTEWTSCNATCGPGVRIRTRSLLMPPDDPQVASLKDSDYGTYFDEDAQKEGDMPVYAEPPCNMYKVLETEPCVGDPSSCEFTESEAREEEEQTTTEDTATEGELQIYGHMIEKSGEPVEGTERPVRNCKFSRWSEWSECDAVCGQPGYKERTRYIQVHARNGGKACTGKTRKQKKCTRKCFENGGDEEEVKHENRGPGIHENKSGCRYDTWTGWTECTATCGMNAVRQRTRGIMAGDPSHCTDRLRKRQCNVGPCPH